MAIISGSNIQAKESRTEKYTKLDNVKDIKQDLSKLKQQIQGSEETKDISPDEKITFSKDKESLSTEQKREHFVEWMDKIVEYTFDDYVKDPQNNARIKALLKAWEAWQKQLEEEFNTKIRQRAFIEFDTHYLILQANLIKEFRFELNILEQSVIDNMLGLYVSDGTYINPNALNRNKRELEQATQQATSEKYRMYHDYIDPYQSFSYANTHKKMDIADIHNDGRVKRYLEKFFDEEEDQKAIRRGMFSINLSTEDGFSSIIIAIREAIAVGNKENPDKKDPAYLLWRELKNNGIINKKKYKVWSTSHETRTLDVDRKKLKNLIDEGHLKYDRKWWWDNELGKIAKVLTRAEWKDLDTFASVMQTKENEVMSIKELHNTREFLRHVSINEKNVLAFLCDFDSSGNLSVEKNKEMKKLKWDIGPLFGQQVYFTIEQAIKIQDVEYPREGEQKVIWNILKNMEITDRRCLENTHLMTMKNNPDTCTKDNLAKLINGSIEDGIYAMPEMKIFFLDAIKKINGGGKATTPNLYDTLVGKDMETSINNISSETELNSTLTTYLQQSKDPKIQALIATHGVVEVRQRLFGHIMNTINNVRITTNDWATTTLQAAGISKWWEVQELRNTLIQETVKKIITTGIHYMKDKWFIVDIGKGKSWTSDSWTFKRAWSTWAGVEIGPAGISVFVSLWWEAAEQINYRRVINADLSQVKNAKYIGIEWWVKAWINTKELSGSAEASGWLFLSKDPIVGINQIDTNYRELAERIFNVESASITNVLSNANTCKKYFNDKIDRYKGDLTYGEFVTTNERHLKNNVDFIVRYMEANKLFGEDSFLAKKSSEEQRKSLDYLLLLLQTGCREARRHDVVAGLHGKIDITRLSFGITTRALTTSFGTGKTPEPTAISTSGETQETGEMSWWHAGSQDPGKDRFGIAWFYVGLNISTWKNRYVPKTENYLFKEYQLKKGTWLNQVSSTIDNPTKYAAYLKALYNDDRLYCYADNNEKIIIRPREWEDINLAQFLNIHATPQAQGKYTLIWNVLTIGNVGDIGAYTVTEAKGVRRVLCLWSKALDDARRITTNTTNTTAEAIKPKHTGYETRTQTAITNTLIPAMKWNAEWLANAKTETSKFFADGKLITPNGYTVEFSPTTIQGEKLSTWSLSITKKEDGTHYVAYRNTPNNKLVISYFDDNIYAEKNREARNNPANRKETPYTINELFAYEWELLNAQNLLNNLANDKDIFDAEKNNSSNYYKFLSSASRVSEWNTIDTKELNTAINYLRALLPNRHEDINQLQWYLNSSDKYVRTYAINRFKQIFARNARHTANKNIWEIVRGRNGREHITWPSKEKLPSNLQKELKEQHNIWSRSGEKYNTSVQANPNLIGYTAFYRNFGGQEQNKAYSLTSLGNTASQVTPYNIENTTEASKRFINNFEKNQYDVEQFAYSLEQQFRKQWLTVHLRDNDYTTTFENIRWLLQGEELLLDSWNKISIDVNRVFYLLAECVNESIGFEIKKIKITSLKSDIDLPGKYTAEGTSDKTYSYTTSLHGSSYSVPSNVVAKEQKVWRRHHISRNNRAPEAHAESWVTQKPNSDTDGGGWTQDGGNIDGWGWGSE